MTETELETHRTEIRALKAMFETDGWQIFIREHKSNAETLRSRSWDTIHTIDQLNHMKGFLGCLESVANYETLVEAREAQLEAQLEQSDE